MAGLKEHLLNYKLAGSFPLSVSNGLPARLRFPGQKMEEFLSVVVKDTTGILRGDRTVLHPNFDGS